MLFQEITEQNRAEINRFIQECWFSTDIIIRGRVVDMTQADGIAVYEGNAVIGLITYEIAEKECEILSLDSKRENIGIGTELVNRVIEIARDHGCHKIKLITTNDNINAIRFYQKRGFDMARLYHNALDISRQLKPSIPLTGDFGIPIKHEIEFEITGTSTISQPKNYVEELRQIVGHRPLILVGSVVIIIDHDFRILLQKRKSTSYGMWGLPGGLMELGESVEETACREVYEETGLTIDNLKLIDVFSGSDHFVKVPNGDEFFSVTVAYYSRDMAGELRIEESESLELQFVSMDNLPENIVENHKKIIDRFVETYSESLGHTR